MTSPLFQVFTISLALSTALADCNFSVIQGNKINGEEKIQMQEEGPKMEYNKNIVDFDKEGEINSNEI